MKPAKSKYEGGSERGHGGRGEEWSTPNESWLDMEAVEDGETFFINTVQESNRLVECGGLYELVQTYWKAAWQWWSTRPDSWAGESRILQSLQQSSL
jgi:hypothetical protein